MGRLVKNEKIYKNCESHNIIIYSMLQSIPNECLWHERRFVWEYVSVESALESFYAYFLKGLSTQVRKICLRSIRQMVQQSHCCYARTIIYERDSYVIFFQPLKKNYVL